jgi:hypothetical protein
MSKKNKPVNIGAFERGNAAFHAGKKRSSNPYPRYTKEEFAWYEGWDWGMIHAE